METENDKNKNKGNDDHEKSGGLNVSQPTKKILKRQHESMATEAYNVMWCGLQSKEAVYNTPQIIAQYHINQILHYVQLQQLHYNNPVP